MEIHVSIYVLSVGVHGIFMLETFMFSSVSLWTTDYWEDLKNRCTCFSHTFLISTVCSACSYRWVCEIWCSLIKLWGRSMCCHSSFLKDLSAHDVIRRKDFLNIVVFRKMLILRSLVTQRRSLWKPSTQRLFIRNKRGKYNIIYS